MSDDELFRPGGALFIPFYFGAGSRVPGLGPNDLVQVDIWKGSEKIATLIEGNGITVTTRAPATAPRPQDQIRQGLIEIDGAMTANWPIGPWVRIAPWIMLGGTIPLPVKSFLLKGVL